MVGIWLENRSWYPCRLVINTWRKYFECRHGILCHLERVVEEKIVGLTTNAPNQVLTALSIGAFVAAAVYDIAVYEMGVAIFDILTHQKQKNCCYFFIALMSAAINNF